MEKFDPTNEPFDPHRHNAVFQVPDNSKPPGTVAHVLKVLFCNPFFIETVPFFDCLKVYSSFVDVILVTKHMN